VTPEDRDLIAAYALDALSPEEREAAEALLARDPEARAELAHFLEVAAELGRAFPASEPPRELRERIMGRLQPRARPEARWQVAFALAAAVAVVLGGLAYTLYARLVGLEVRLARQEQVLALLASPTARVATLTGRVPGSVRLVYDPQGNLGALVVRDLQDPGAGFVYQLWLVTGQRADSGGVFRPVPGQSLVLPIQADFRRYEIVAITVERGPLGVARTQNQPVLVGRL